MEFRQITVAPDLKHHFQFQAVLGIKIVMIIINNDMEIEKLNKNGPKPIPCRASLSASVLELFVHYMMDGGKRRGELDMFICKVLLITEHVAWCRGWKMMVGRHKRISEFTIKSTYAYYINVPPFSRFVSNSKVK